MNHWIKVLIAALVISNVILFGLYLNLNQKVNHQDSDLTNQVSTRVTEFSNEITDNFSQAQSSIVYISTDKQGLYSHGSGIIFGAENGVVDIVTNSAIVANASIIEVSLANGQTLTANLIGSDSYADIALLQINVDFEVPLMTLGSSQLLKPGQFVSVIGSNAVLSNNITFGVLSTINRWLDVDTDNDQHIDWQVYGISSDAIVNANNTGGALLNIDGEMIGLVSLKVANSMGISSNSISVSIPIDEVKMIVEQIKSNTTTYRSFFGINGLDISNMTTYQKSNLGIGLDITNGIYVSSVYEPSAASNSNLMPGDIISTINGSKINTYQDYRLALYNHNPQESMSVTVLRNLETLTLSIQF